MVSAGNSGNQNTDNKYVLCPADGDSVVAVGSIDIDRVIAPASSWGPNSGGHTKPNIVSVGRAAVFSDPTGNPVNGNGTSYSNPNVAGLILCLWQAFTDFTNMEIVDAVQRSSDHFDHPDLNRFGYGIPNFRIAYQYLLGKRKERQESLLPHSWITAFPVPFRQSFTVYLKAPATANAFINLLDISGQKLQTTNISVQQDGFYTVQVNPPALASGIYYLQYNDGKNKTILKVVKL